MQDDVTKEYLPAVVDLEFFYWRWTKFLIVIVVQDITVAQDFNENKKQLQAKHFSFHKFK